MKTQKHPPTTAHIHMTHVQNINKNNLLHSPRHQAQTRPDPNKSGINKRLHTCPIGTVDFGINNVRPHQENLKHLAQPPHSPWQLPLMTYGKYVGWYEQTIHNGKPNGVFTREVNTISFEYSLVKKSSRKSKASSVSIQNERTQSEPSMSNKHTNLADHSEYDRPQHTQNCRYPVSPKAPPSGRPAAAPRLCTQLRRRL